MLTISGYASKSVLTVGFGCRQLSIFCKAGRWCRRYILSGVHRHIHVLELQLWQVPTSTQEDQEGEEGAQSSPEAFHFAKPRIEDWKSGPRDFQLWWGWGHEWRGSAVISKEGSRHSCLKVTLEKWQKAMKCYDWSLWWCIRSNLWWQLIGPLVRSWPETKRHQVYCHVKSYTWLFPTKVIMSHRNFQSGPRFGMASQSKDVVEAEMVHVAGDSPPNLARSSRW